MRGRNTTSRRTSSRRVGAAAAPFERSERTGGRKSPMSCWTRASLRASATSSRTRCCSAPGPARSRKSTDFRPPSCDELPTRRAYSHSASSSCGGSLLCASTWKSMDAARARLAGAKFPARSTARVAAAVFSARSASTRVHGEAIPHARRQRPPSDVAHGVHTNLSLSRSNNHGEWLSPHLLPWPQGGPQSRLRQ
jgi:hypothetical protein